MKAMSVQLTPSKRPHEDSNEPEDNAKDKLHKSEPSTSPTINSIRVLCPLSKLPPLLENESTPISQIRQESRTNIQIQETVPGCEETIILISDSDKDDDFEGNKDEKDENFEEKKELGIEKAVLSLFEKMVDGGEINEGEDKSVSCVMRLMVCCSQVSSLLGKNGSFIKKMCSESGAEIKILPRDKLPVCATDDDDLVQISGELDAMRKALQAVCKQLIDCSSNQDTLSDVQPSRDFSHPSTNQDKSTQSDQSFRGQGPPNSARPRDGERGFPVIMTPSDVLAFHLLCPDEKVGGLIGKGGTIINGLQRETGCEIKVFDRAAGSKERLIAISGPAHPEDRISAAQDAVLCVHSILLRAGPEINERSVTTKLVVASSQIGCLLGKGGSVIGAMRKSSGAHIRLLGKEPKPDDAAKYEVVQIKGQPEAVHDALLQITARLQDRFFRDNPALLDQMPPFSRRRGVSPPGMHHNMGPPFLGGLRPHGGGQQLGVRPPFAHDFRAPGMPEKMASSIPWGPQGMVDGGGPIGFLEYPGAPPRRLGGFGGGNHPATITSTTMEVVVPYSVVPAIYGEDGGCLRQIREISDAKITITDTKPGATETVIIISGTPEQTNAAQSLIQAFVISETEAT